MGEFIGQLIFDSLLQSVKHIGASIKWIFLRKKFSYKEILKQNWNNRIGLLFIIFVIATVMYFTSYW